MITGLDQLETFAERLDRLVELPTRAAKRAAPALLKVAESEYASGESPEGDAWDPLKQGGPTPLRELTGEITASADGSAVVISTPDVLKYHQGGYFVHHGGGGARLREAQASVREAKAMGDAEALKRGRKRVREVKAIIRREGVRVAARRTLPRRKAVPVAWGRALAKAWADEMAATMEGSS